ncbi:MAG TPA: hypothetical protein VML94_07540 [Thermoplasmata archaeon]|nr:hypothetical protein [Thermoplasmata archaeon]
MPHVAWATQRGASLAGFFLAAVTFGLGAAVVDTARAGSPHYYVGWLILALGVLVLLAVSTQAVFRPYGAYALAFLVEVYGWWNVFWAIGDWYLCRGCSFFPSVSLINLRGIWPYGPGVVSLPFWLFAVTSFGAIVLPIGAAAGARSPLPRAREFL